jgi:galactosamine-6-phosphate isomerase
LCILGLGKNGHVALIEPGPCLEPHCHVAKLSEETLRHAMMSSREAKPAYGMTLGIGDILQARKIVLLVTGTGKERVIARFLEGTVTTDLPATFLWLHPDVEVFLDDSSR